MFIIDFENDAPGPKENGFQSVDSDIVTFTDSVGGFTGPPGSILTDGLIVEDFGDRTIGQGLAVATDQDDSALVMDFATPVNSLGLSFGNDTFGLATIGEMAVLTAFNSGVQVGQAEVEMNLNGMIDQTIEILDVGFFDRATFKFEVDPTRGLIEMVDNITFGVPEPASIAALFLLSACLYPSTFRRKNQRSQ